MRIIVALIVLALAGAAIWLFNRLVRMRNQVHVAWSDIDVQLQRRHDLVPMLVEVVKAYASHERNLFERITSERRAAQTSLSPAARGVPETALGKDLGRLIAVAEAYPDLKASGNFRQLSDELVAVEDAIQHARRFYNGSVREYNTAIQRFPALLFARPFGFEPAEFFAAEEDARANVEAALGAQPSD
ncbi:MAG TPA: LemA family protein [Rhodanobacteraceae bacterium]|nr:LemA family protein [Rhodanobacteraceae bacterium]